MSGAASGARKVRAVTFSADKLEDGARAATGLDDFGTPYYREGLERTVEALNTEADLNNMGQVIQHATISNALIQRLKIEASYAKHPEIDDEVVGGPVFVIGLLAPGRRHSANWWPPILNSVPCGCGSRRRPHRHRRPQPSTQIRESLRPKQAYRRSTKCFR